MSRTFPSIFSSTYWADAAAEYKKLVTLVMAALTIALATVINAVVCIPVGENLHISFAFLVIVVGSIIFGPVVGISVGFLYDFVGFILAPATVFFPGYTLSSMLEFFIYGLFLYHRPLSIVRIACAKCVVNYGIHVGLGSLWSSILYSRGFYYYLVKSLIKNSILLPIEVFTLVLMLQILLPLLAYNGSIPKLKTKRIPLL